MSAQLILNFDNPTDLMRVLQLLKEMGLETLAMPPVKPRRKPAPEKEWEGIGSVQLGGALESIPNLRDFAYEN